MGYHSDEQIYELNRNRLAPGAKMLSNAKRRLRVKLRVGELILE